MSFYIQEWADRSATLITREGHRLFSFRDVASALQACGQWYGVSERHVIPHQEPSASRLPARAARDPIQP